MQIESYKTNKNNNETKKTKPDFFETNEIPLNKASYHQTVRGLKTNASMAVFNERRNQEKIAKNA